MSDLLNTQQHADIRAALQNVVDTFCKTPVVYSRAKMNLDRAMEDMGDMAYDTLNLTALVEYTKQMGDDTNVRQEGSINAKEAVLTLGMDDLIAIGGIIDPTTFAPLLSDTRDFFVVAGERYKTSYVGVEGAIEQKNILVIVKGKQDLHST